MMQINNKNKQYLLATKLRVRQHDNFKEEGARKSVHTKTFVIPEGDSNNIFKTIISNQNYKQNTGPKYNEKGQIIPYTVVGNPKWFMNKSQKKKGANFDEQVKQLQTTQVMKANDDLKSMRQQGQKKPQRKLEIRTKGQLLDEMESIRVRMERNEAKSKKELQEYDPLVRNYLTKAQRLFEKHKSTVEFWDDMSQRQAARLSRMPQESQLVRSEEYLQKVEIAQNFEAAKNQFEQFGTRVWYMTLRESSNVPKPVDTQVVNGQELKVERQLELPLIVNEDIPNAFKHSSVSGMRQSIQYIRKPLQSERLKTITTNSMTYLHSLNGSIHSGNDEYLNTKLNSTKNKFHENYMLDYDQAKQLDDLFVVGRSQFQLELEALMHDSGTNMATYRKYLDVLEVDQEEDYAVDLPKLEKLFVKKNKSHADNKQYSVSHHTDNLSQTDFF